MDYQKLLNESLIEFVRKVLTKVQHEGLQGEHHFYLSFITSDPYVQLSARIKAHYSEEITIVLQNRFENLIVNSDSFSVKLAFNNVPEVIVVPFRCLTGFSDPSVNFNLQFSSQSYFSDPVTMNSFNSKEEEVQDSKLKSTKIEKLANNVIVLDKFRK